MTGVSTGLLVCVAMLGMIMVVVVAIDVDLIVVLVDEGSDVVLDVVGGGGGVWVVVATVCVVI